MRKLMKPALLRALLLAAVSISCLTAAAAEFVVDGITYSDLGTNAVAVTGFSGSVKEAVIPETVKYRGKNYTVIAVGGYSWQIPSIELTTLTIPASVVEIKYSYFNETLSYRDYSTSYKYVVPFSKLKAVNVSADNPVYSSQDGVLYNKSKTKLLSMPKASGLTNFDIPQSVTSIGNEAFQGCSMLESVSIPASVTSIGSCAFSDCTSLVSITIPSSVTEIGGGAFSDCTSLESVSIPASVTSIGSCAFSDCTSLVSITIPSSVTEIGGGAFEGMCRIATVTCEATDPVELKQQPFSEMTLMYGTLYVPKGSKQKYRNAKGWSDFDNIKEIGE